MGVSQGEQFHTPTSRRVIFSLHRRRMGKKKRDAAKRDTRTKAQRTGNVPLWPSKEFWTAAEAQNSATQGTRDKRLAQGRLLHIPPLSNASKRWATAPKKAGSYRQIQQMANPNKQAAALALRKWHSLHFKNGIASLAVGGYVAARWFNIVENATARALYGKELQVDPPYPWPPFFNDNRVNNTTTTGFITAAAVFAVSFRLQVNSLCPTRTPECYDAGPNGLASPGAHQNALLAHEPSHLAAVRLRLYT